MTVGFCCGAVLLMADASSDTDADEGVVRRRLLTWSRRCSGVPCERKGNLHTTQRGI